MTPAERRVSLAGTDEREATAARRAEARRGSGSAGAHRQPGPLNFVLIGDGFDRDAWERRWSEAPTRVAEERLRPAAGTGVDAVVRATARPT
jgi:hypothetical protein